MSPKVEPEVEAKVEAKVEGEAERIAVLSPALADQIAAGEVVERPASIVKELIENSIDAGARRIEVELEAGGRERIRVIDDGRGIHRDDLELALTRHATSKLHRPEQLVEIHTLGFRGEALASIAAVARVDLRSRPPGERVGHRLYAQAGQLGSVEPLGMPHGTQVEIVQLFASVPARRKFLRSEATEVGHCVEAVVRVALVHPEVQFKLRHSRRVLLELATGDAGSRVAELLARRGGPGPYHHICGERDGVRVEGWFAPPSSATRQRGASFVVVRRRVVRERTLAAVLKQAYGDSLAPGLHPVACLFVEPPAGSVDVNVHPQKSEVRFAAAQQLFAAVRSLVELGMADAPWFAREPESPADTLAAEEHSWARPRGDQATAGARAALADWSRRASLGPPATTQDRAPGVGYRLGTRAAGGNYAADKQGFRAEVEQLRAGLAEARAPRPFPTASDAEPVEAPARPEPALPGPRYLSCLPGPVALFDHGGELLAVDLRRVRAELVRRRLLRELSQLRRGTRVPAQGLLEPVVVRRRKDERALLLREAPALAELGLELEGFGDDAVLVRAVPAVLRTMLAAPEIDGLIERLLPWLAMRQAQAREPGDEHDGYVEAIAAASRRPVDPSPRLARSWLAELLRESDGELEGLGGVRRWTASELV